MGTKLEPGEFDCYEHAAPDEPMFTLLARDRTAPDTVREWCRLREQRVFAAVQDGSATPNEVLADMRQIIEARQCADAMEAWRTEHRP